MALLSNSISSGRMPGAPGPAERLLGFPEPPTVAVDCGNGGASCPRLRAVGRVAGIEQRSVRRGGTFSETRRGVLQWHGAWPSRFQTQRAPTGGNHIVSQLEAKVNFLQIPQGKTISNRRT